MSPYEVPRHPGDGGQQASNTPPTTRTNTSALIGYKFAELLKQTELLSEEQYRHCTSVTIRAVAGEIVTCTVETLVTVGQAEQLAAGLEQPPREPMADALLVIGEELPAGWARDPEVAYQLVNKYRRLAKEALGGTP